MTTIAPYDTTRAGDRDRETTASYLGQALAQGYLDLAEYEKRLAATFGAHTRTELGQLLSDLPVHHLRRHDPRRLQARHAAARMSVRIHLAAYLVMAVVVLTVWLAVALSADAWYFWPVWPILGGGIGLAAHAIPIRFAIKASAAST